MDGWGSGPVIVAVEFAIGKQWAWFGRLGSERRLARVESVRFML
jgi:hypothetical protein